jgi:pyrroloquinoline quinone biosynthesis protein D
VTASVDMSLVPKLRRGVRLRYDGHTRSYLLLAPERGLLLSDSAAAVLGYCDGQRCVGEVVDQLVQRGVPPYRAQVDVCDLLSDLSQRGLVGLREAS